MPRYFFDLHDGRRQFHDDIGSEMPDLQSGRDEAVGYLSDFVSDRLKGEESREFIASIRDEAGHVLFRAKLSLATERLDRPEPIRDVANGVNGRWILK